MEKIKNIIKQWEAEMITTAERDHLLSEGTAPIHGAYNDGKYTGYDYSTQHWVEIEI